MQLPHPYGTTTTLINKVLQRNLLLVQSGVVGINDFLVSLGLIVYGHRFILCLIFLPCVCDVFVLVSWMIASPTACNTLSFAIIVQDLLVHIPLVGCVVSAFLTVSVTVTLTIALSASPKTFSATHVKIPWSDSSTGFICRICSC